MLLVAPPHPAMVEEQREVGARSVEFRDPRGHARALFVSPVAIRVRTRGFIDRNIVESLFATIDAHFATLSENTPRAVFMDHRAATGVSWGNAMHSLRWYIHRHERVVVHMLVAGLHPFIRLSIALCYPILARECVFHSSVESFDAALAERSQRSARLLEKRMREAAPTPLSHPGPA